MKTRVRFVFALAVTLMGSGCGSGGGGGRHVMPNGLVHISFAGFDEGPVQPIDADDAARVRDALKEKDQGRAEGTERWFFHAFDAHDLEFVVARLERVSGVDGRYVAVTRYRVARSTHAERVLGVENEVKSYERSEGGTKGGMTPEEVEAQMGKPLDVVPLGPWGSFDYVYPDACLRFLQGKLASRKPRSYCRP